MGCKGTKKKREWETEKIKDLFQKERLNRSGLQTNSLVPFLKAAVTKMKAMLFSILATVRQLEFIKNQVKRVRWSFLRK